jgi:hypothetical protein
MKRTSLVLFILTSLFSYGKVRDIYINRSLNEAKHIQTVVIHGYTDSLLLCSPVGAGDTLKVEALLRWREITESFRKNLIEKKWMEPDDLAGKWPGKGDTVLIVINERDRVEVFARKIANKYRFWDPNNAPFTNSVFFIPKQKPFYQLPVCKEIWKRENYWTCEDGCLVDVKAIRETKKNLKAPTLFIIPDSNQYSANFMRELRTKFGKFETVTLVKNKIIINKDKKNAVLIPTDLPLNSVVNYSGDSIFQVPVSISIKRINFSTIQYEYREKEKTVQTGFAHIQPSIYFGAGNLFKGNNEKFHETNLFTDRFVENWYMDIFIGVGDINQLTLVYHSFNGTFKVNLFKK